MGDNLPQVAIDDASQPEAGGHTTCIRTLFGSSLKWWGKSGPGLGRPALIVSGNNIGDQRREK
jgi:hypothetical protein